MLKFNMYLYYGGMVLTAIAVLIGLPILIFGNQEIGKFFVQSIGPFGFLLWFTGFIGYTLIRPSEDRNSASHEEAKAYQSRIPD